MGVSMNENQLVFREFENQFSFLDWVCTAGLCYNRDSLVSGYIVNKAGLTAGTWFNLNDHIYAMIPVQAARY